MMMIDYGDVISHGVTSLIGLAASVIGLYVSYRIAVLKSWISKEVTKIVKENSAGKDSFDAHVRADELFQSTLTLDIKEKREDYRQQHEDHYRHERKAEIHQITMSAATLDAKFEDVKNQVGDVRRRVEKLIEAKQP